MLRLTTLEEQVASLESRVETLETDLNEMAMAHSYRFKPDFDSGWIAIAARTSLQIDGNFPNQFWDGCILFHLMGRSVKILK